MWEPVASGSAVSGSSAEGQIARWRSPTPAVRFSGSQGRNRCWEASESFGIAPTRSSRIAMQTVSKSLILEADASRGEETRPGSRARPQEGGTREPGMPDRELDEAAVSPGELQRDAMRRDLVRSRPELTQQRVGSSRDDG